MKRRAAALLGLVVALTGAAKPDEIPEPPGGRIDLRVCLVLDDALRATAWRRHPDLPIAPTPDGEALARAAEGIGRAVFTSVTVEATASACRADAVLVPRVIEVVWLANGDFDGRKRTLILEWSMRRPDGARIWVETIEASQRLGQRPNVQRDEFLRRSVETLGGAREIRSHASSIAARASTRR